MEERISKFVGRSTEIMQTEERKRMKKKMNRTSREMGHHQVYSTKTDHNGSPGRRGKEQDYTERNNC